MQAKELNLLVVEDDAFQRGIVVEMLRSLGVNSISEASNGKQAIDIVRDESKPVDVILCDLNMPEMDGLEFLRHLGKEHHNVAIAIVSALDSKLLLSAGKMAKMHGIKLLDSIEKPISLEQIKDLLDRYKRSESKWQHSTTAVEFTLEDILQGIQEKQFEPFFQPKVELQTGRLIGAEALARWIHPTHGVVSPFAFVPKLEQSGSIEELTFLMLAKAAEICRQFHGCGCLLSVSVNLSLVSLNDPTLADKVNTVIQNAGAKPQDIVLEITETAAMTDIAQALENLTRLVMNGFALSIDDYGTGYSSLQQLSRVVFSELKIDQSFTKGITEDEIARIIVESSIDMAHKLNVKSVAEGVETKQQWDMLKQMGCDTAQGYLIGKPMDRDTFIEFCQGYTPDAFA